MPVTFDPVNKWILLTDVLTITAQEIYNEAMNWHDEESSMGYDLPMSAVGFAPLGGGAYTDKIFILINGWKIKPYAGTYILQIVGTLITDDSSSRLVLPDSGVVTVIFQVASQGILSVTGSGVLPQDIIDIADAVETQTGAPIKASVDDIADEVSFIKKVEEGRWKIVGNQLIIYDSNGTTPLKTFNLKDANGNPTQTNVLERTPV